MKQLNYGWQFQNVWDDEFLTDILHDEIVDLPHNIEPMPLHYASSDAYQKTSGYRKTLTFDDTEKRYFLQFDGIGHIADVYFNGKHLAQHRNGYTMFRVEITDEIDFTKPNTLVVKVDSHEDPSIPPFGHVVDYLTYGGIYRPVWLDERPQSYVEDVFVTTPTLNRVHLELTYANPDHNQKVELKVYDTNHTVVYESDYDQPYEKIDFAVNDVTPWSIEHPTLYTLEIKYGLDTYTTTFGFRTIAIEKDTFLLNGQQVFITGLNRHQSFPYIGYAATDSLQVEDARILKEELHVNAVRTSHYPQSQAFIDACDRFGLLVFTEIPGWQHIGDEAWIDQAVKNTEEMVRQYRNHPSIVMWGVRINESLDNDDFYKRTNAVAHQLDPTRPTTGVRYIEKSSLLEDIYSYNDFSHSGLNLGCKKKKDVTPDMDKPLLISEANGHMFPTKASDRPERLQEHALRHARVLNDAMADHQHIGAFQWCMFDYQTHQDFGSGDRICYHGVMDSFRNPKLAASVYASQSEQEDILEVGTSMSIGDYDGGHLDSFYAFTNADEVKLYKNDHYVKSFTPDTRFKALKHGPIKIDDTIGELLKSQEGLQGTQEKLIHQAMLAAQQYGINDLPKKDLLKLGWVMLHYHMKYEDGVALYGKYVGGWGDDVITWRFDAMKDGQVVKSITKKPSTKLHLEVIPSSTHLCESPTYDMASFRVRLLDEYNNLVPYNQLPLTISTTGPIEILGPSFTTLEGGMSGTYIRTINQRGSATVTFSTRQTIPVTIELTISHKEYL